MHIRVMLASLILASSSLALEQPIGKQANSHISRADSHSAYIAVATNFKTTADVLVETFKAHTDHQLIIASGSTGKLFNQVKQGAPFDLFLSADEARARRLIEQGLGVPGSQSTYALGRLVLLGNQPTTIADLQQNQFRRLAIANPQLAPYGMAARQTLDRFNLTDLIADKIVMGENVGQAYAMIATGNADVGFVALSMVKTSDQANTWLVPAEYHEPIRQDLVLLNHGRDNPAARAFMAFMSSAEAGQIIEAAGYQRSAP